MARTSIPWALRKVNCSTAVPSGSLPNGARVTPDLPAARAGSGLLCSAAEPPDTNSRTPATARLARHALMHHLRRIDLVSDPPTPDNPSYHMARALPASPTDHG